MSALDFTGQRLGLRPSREIAHDMGCSHETVCKAVRDAGLSPYKAPRIDLSGYPLGQIPAKEIAEAAGCSAYVVCRAVDDAGLPQYHRRRIDLSGYPLGQIPAREIAEAAGCSIGIVHRAIRDAGIAPYKPTPGSRSVRPRRDAMFTLPLSQRDKVLGLISASKTESDVYRAALAHWLTSRPEFIRRAESWLRAGSCPEVPRSRERFTEPTERAQTRIKEIEDYAIRLAAIDRGTGYASVWRDIVAEFLS